MKKKDRINKIECNLIDAIKIMKSNKNKNFDESIDIYINLNLVNQKKDYSIKESIILPFNNGKKNIILAFVNKEQEKEALENGADFCGSNNLIDLILEKKIKYNKVLTVTNLLPIVGKVAKILGPKNLMPNLKTNTVSDNIIDLIKEYKNNRIIYKSNKDGIINLTIGKISFEENIIKENFNFVVQNIKKNKNSFSKVLNIKSIYICPTMGRSYKII